MGKKILIDVSERGRAGGKAKRDAMTPEARSEMARRMVNLRWDRYRAAKAAAAEEAAKRKPRPRRKEIASMGGKAGGRGRKRAPVKKAAA
jgi:hypothetical protein